MSESSTQKHAHRIVAEGDLQALQTIWKSNDAGENNLLQAVDSATWELLLRMVRPVPDQEYNENTTSMLLENKEEESSVLPPDETWEAWVDQSALERVRQLRSQVRARASSVREKQRKVLESVELLLSKQQEKQENAEKRLAPPLDPAVQQACTAKAQQTQQQVDHLVQEMDNLQVKIPDVVQRFHETLSTVQEEERLRRADRAVTSPSNKVLLLGQSSQDEENAIPVQERLLRFLMTH